MNLVTNTVKKLRSKKSVDVSAQPVQPLLSLDNPQPSLLSGETAMAKKPSEVLNLFLNPSGRYMAHFFHFIGDIPVIKEETKKTRKGDKTITKAETKKPKLYLSDVDAIVKRHSDLGGKQTFETIAIGMLEPALMNELEAAKLDVDAVISWAKEEGKTKLASMPKKAKTAAPKADPDVRTLVRIFASVEGNTTPEQLITKLIKLVNDAPKVEEAKKILETAKTKNGRDKNGYIKLRDRS